MPSQVLLLNSACRSDCAVCPPTGTHDIYASDLDDLLERLDPHTNLYVGIDAFERAALLPALIRICRSNDVSVHLFTRGQHFETIEDAASALTDLRAYGPFSVLTVCDRPHWELTDKARFECWLKAVKFVGLFPELPYLQQPHELVPSDLLVIDELNTFSTIYCRDAAA